MSNARVRTLKTFMDECLELLGDRLAVVSAAEMGMAYRAWTGEAGVSDDAVVDRLLAASPPGSIHTVRRGGSVWVNGAQLSDIGHDMVMEGHYMHDMLGTVPEESAG